MFLKHSIVSDEIIGQEGEVNVDNLTQPTKVIGIANGLDGVKSDAYLNGEEKSKIEEVQQLNQQNI